jgi:hypothetical protein
VPRVCCLFIYLCICILVCLLLLLFVCLFVCLVVVVVVVLTEHLDAMRDGSEGSSLAAAAAERAAARREQFSFLAPEVLLLLLLLLWIKSLSLSLSLSLCSLLQVFVNVRSLTVKSDIFQWAIVAWELIQHTLTGRYARAGAELIEEPVTMATAVVKVTTHLLACYHSLTVPKIRLSRQRRVKRASRQLAGAHDWSSCCVVAARH